MELRPFELPPTYTTLSALVAKLQTKIEHEPDVLARLTYTQQRLNVEHQRAGLTS